MTANGLLNFGAWTLRVDSRELRVHGEVQEIERKAFDLLALLIEERPRVVLRGELMERVWGGADVSENVVARTVMKARKAIGDRADDSSLIRTVHRVGYRFVGEPVTQTPSTVAVDPPLVRIGLLPFENLTGLTDLAWMEEGLTALVGQALEDDRRLSVVPTATLARAIASTGGKLEEPTIRHVERLLGLQCVVQSRIHCDVRCSISTTAPWAATAATCTDV